MALSFGQIDRIAMTPSDVAFSRAIIASVVVFAVVALACFRPFGQRVMIALVRRLPVLLPTVGVASVGASLVFDLPLVAKVLLWLLGASSVFVCMLALIAIRSMRSVSKARLTT